MLLFNCRSTNPEYLLSLLYWHWVSWSIPFCRACTTLSFEKTLDHLKLKSVSHAVFVCVCMCIILEQSVKSPQKAKKHNFISTQKRKEER
ncbi:hypothetical protein BCR43DRAFT_221653 [Syncephalastrum racemosum]|uniref:Uncharacterized protein n=1 Tax=Syncephalastrum racemosum TaxID=13706 RepID=A0A1X2HJ98_SYNRA|nr:hypothetical protein BCR43DRAFT_221653 [Syncephalastrum racemosum]